MDSYIYKGDDNCYYEKIGSEIKNITNLIPFYIPENWSWARLGYIIDFSKNADVSSNDINDNDWILDLEDIEKASGKLLCKKRMIEVKSKSDKHKFFIGKHILNNSGSRRSGFVYRQIFQSREEFVIYKFNEVITR